MNKKITMFLMNEKGYAVLKNFLQMFGAKYIDSVVVAEDKNVRKDYYDDIWKVCTENQISVLDRGDVSTIKSEISFAIGWKWIIKDVDKLIVFHDSLLPRYRGFAPLVNSLINREDLLGVTALFASEEYDRGEIIAQRSLNVKYPIKIEKAIEEISKLYVSLVEEVMRKLISGQVINSEVQDENRATYSLWRDEEDYTINWYEDAIYIKRFIDATGYPFKGASSFIEETKVRITDSVVVDDVKIEIRTPGKIIFFEDGFPIVVCGKGLLKILSIRDDKSQKELLPLKKFRVRFK
ncbi:methionyl-tRNA formyltransferase [Paenibacillus polymyxa]|uniref:methionyl-tRNA formyltransferase n=1 Tax=Paenibacillus polymyxa TaxID=1406 RepID=UPI0003D31F54|nr:formyltransferase family protein [Paenibacillus polymyxa]AHC22015.2 hypothetical protein X809_24445 [Paenibacillus polymyxa CR1]